MTMAPDNQEELEFLKKNVVEKYEVLKIEVEEVPEPPAKEEQENLHPQFQRSTSNELTEARCSIHLQKGGRGNKPRDIKKQSSKRKEEHFDPLKPNWEDETPVAPTTAMVEARPPPPPSRTTSRVPLQRQANNNNYDDGAKTNLRLSDLLYKWERESLREYVGENDGLLASGVCQLLKEEDGKWSVFGVGVVCLIKNNADRIFSISLVEPSNDGTPARVVWFTALSRQFLTTKNHSNLLSFEIKIGNSQQVFGLNFSDQEKAAFFHKIIFEAYHSYQNRKSIRKGSKRMVPPPPSMPLPDQSCLAEDISSHGVEIPIVRVKKEKKKGLLGRTRDKIFGEEKSKKDKPDISALTNFQHVQHGLQDLTEEQKSIVKVLMEKGLKIEPDNQEPLEFLKKNVVEKYEVLKMEVEEVPEPPAKEEQMPAATTTAMVEARPPPPPSRTASRVPLQRQEISGLNFSDQEEAAFFH